MKTFLFMVVACALAGISGSASGSLHSMQRVRVDSIPRNLSPKNDTVFNCIPATVTLRWSPGTSFDNSYFVELSGDSTFENPIVSEVVVINTSFVCPVPQADTTVYWRIRTQFDTTAIWRITLRRPLVPTTLLPSTDTVTDNPVRFAWNKASGGSTTELLIEGEAYTRRDTVADDTTHYATLLGFKSYSWRVRTLCGDGHSDWSVPRTFYLNTVTNSVAFEQSSLLPVHIDSDPASNFLFIRHENGVALGTIRILSLLGNTVATASAAGSPQLMMDIRSLSSGVYLLAGEDESQRSWTYRLQIAR
jgi:hypothetical protein